MNRCRAPQPRRARAFTLLETMLAAAIGALVVAACVGVFSAVEKNEMRLRARSTQVMALSRMHTVMRRAFTSFIMAEQARTTSSITTGAGAGAGAAAAASAASGAAAASKSSSGVADAGAGGEATDPNSKRFSSVADAMARAKASRDALAASLPPRFLLSADPEAEGLQMTHPVEAVHAPGQIQRFEMVLSRYPVPTVTWDDPNREAALITAARKRADADDSKVESRNGTKSAKDAPKSDRDDGTYGWGRIPPEEAKLPQPMGQSVRGAFELRPTPGPAGAPPVLVDGRPRSWTLYWQPLTPLPSTRPESEKGLPPPVAVPMGPAVEIASDLEYVHWQVFRERERRGAHRGLWYTDLPAYIEMEVKTIDGLWANWMFEVDWATGSESDGTLDVAGSGTGSGSGRTDGAATPSSNPGTVGEAKIQTLKSNR